MGEPTISPGISSLDPTAPLFSMPEESVAPTNGALKAPATQSLPNGQSIPTNQPKRPDKQHSRNPTAEKVPNAGSFPKPSGAELKKQKATEKAARRAEKVAEKGTQAQPIAQTPSNVQASAASLQLQRRLSGSRKDGESFHKRAGSTSLTAKQMPIRNAGPLAEVKERVKEEKKVGMFSHLYTRERRSSIAGVGKEIHPSVLALGIQLRDFVISGGNARCVAMLLVFKKVIQAYSTPPGIALSRHLTTHLGHQISYLSHSRALSVSQGNAIRWLKKLISSLDPDLSDSSARQFLCESIDQFIRERITLADELIQKEASQRISDGDVLLTYAKSSIVEKTFLSAHKQGKKFRVVVVDSRPLFEGKNLARSLSTAGLTVQYSLLNGLADVAKTATKCFLGASAMMGNGGLYSRAGSAMVAMMMKEVANAPVIVLCESVKFTGKVALDSIIMNELGDANALVETETTETLTLPLLLAPAAVASTKGIGGGGKKGGGKDADDVSDELTKKKKGLEGWKEQANLHLLNLMYDVTPIEYLDMVITEMGNLPPSAVPVVNGIHGGDE